MSPRPAKKKTKKTARKKPTPSRRPQNTKKTCKTKPLRDKNGRLLKGQSGNPGGRPKKNREIEQQIQALIERPDGSNVVLDRLFAIATTGSNRDACEASKLLLAYGYGKPTQRTELSGPGGKEVQVMVVAGKEIVF